MPITRITKDARATIARAEAEARRSGSATLEAEHLLLALSTDPATAPVLARFGLDGAGAQAALRAGRDTSLAAVGVRAVDYGDPPQPVAIRGRAPRMAASTRSALEQGLLAAERGGRRIEPRHLLLGLLAAPEGTVPRALRAIGVQREAIARAVAQAPSASA